MAKRKKKRAKVINMQPKLSLKKYIKLNARKLEIHEVYVADGLFDSGKGHVLFVRKKKNGQKLIGSYLVDTWCLGIKDTFYLLLEDFEYPEFLQQFHQHPNHSMSRCSPNHASNIVYGAIEYAEDLGIEPHKDFDVTEYILLDVDDVEYEELTFGDNGVPHFMSYPTDNVGDILRRLNASVGKDGYIHTDGEMFLDDDFIMEDELPFGPDELADMHLSDEIDKNEYLSYCLFLTGIAESALPNLEKHKRAFVKNPEAYLDLLDPEFLSMIKAMFNQNVDEKAEIEDRIRSIAEKFLIHESIEFITYEYNVLAFDSELDDDVKNSIHKSNLFQYGQEKLNTLASFAIGILQKYEPKYADLKALENNYSEWLSRGIMSSTYLKELEEIFELFEEHEQLWGHIDFESISTFEISID